MIQQQLYMNSDGELRIALYTDEDTSDIQERYPDAKVQHIKNFAQPFRALPRDNDIVILKDIFHLHQAKDRLLKVAYTTLANTAEIIIMQKKGTMDIEAMTELLTESEYRAANYIDVLPEYDLVMAKKMHMWGAGL